MDNLSIGLIVFGAIGDSINPCAIAVLVFLITFLISIKKRGKDFLTIGLIYILCVYLTYLLAGIGFMTIIQKLDITRIIYIVSAGVVIITGLINIFNVLFYDKGTILAIPESRKPIIKKYIQKASIPAAIILGILVSLFELPCTGGIYIAILGLIAEQATLKEGFLYLVLYNFIFVLPLIIILILANFSLTSESINAWRKKNKKIMRLVMGIMMLILGGLMISTILTM